MIVVPSYFSYNQIQRGNFLWDHGEVINDSVFVIWHWCSSLERHPDESFMSQGAVLWVLLNYPVGNSHWNTSWGQNTTSWAFYSPLPPVPSATPWRDSFWWSQLTQLVSVTFRMIIICLSLSSWPEVPVLHRFNSVSSFLSVLFLSFTL